MGELSRNNDALRLSYCSFILFFFFVCEFFRERKGEKELRVFLVLMGYSPLCNGGEGIERKRGKKGGEKGVWMKEKG